MKKTTRIWMMVWLLVSFCSLSYGQLAWNPAEWSAGSATVNVEGSTVSVTNLSPSGDNYRADFRLEVPFTVSNNDSWLAFKLIPHNSTWAANDRKLKLLSGYVDETGTEVTIVNQSNTNRFVYSFDSDADGIVDTYVYDLKKEFGANFVAGNKIPATNGVWKNPDMTNSNNTTPGAVRGEMVFVVILTPDAGASAADVWYEVKGIKTYNTVQDLVSDQNVKGIDWNPTLWAGRGTGVLSTPTGNSLVVSNLTASGSNFRADLYYKNPFTVTTAEPYLALQMKVRNGLLNVADRKLQFIGQWKDDSNVVNGFNRENLTTNITYDSDNDGVHDIFIWNLTNALATDFVEGKSNFATGTNTTLVWVNGNNVARSFRGDLKFTVIITPSAGSTVDNVSYEVVRLGTYATEEEASNSIMSSVNKPILENDLNFSSSDGVLTINSKIDRTINIFSLDGRLIKRNLQIESGSNTINSLSKGVYIVEKQKVIVF